MQLAWLAGRLVFRLRVEGRENIPRSGPLLIVSNHLSHLDPPLVAAAFPRPVFYMARHELFRVPFLRAVLRAVKTILVERGRARQSIEAALQYLREGQPVVIFPEGTRSQSGRLGRGLGGAVSLALRSACQILPVAIIGSERALTKGSRWLKAARVEVRIGTPFRLPFSPDETHPPRELVREATLRLMEQIEALLPPHMRPTAEEKASWYGLQPESLA
jgi:1-acyl-sn-glycerol-3-phosphate acyltransferase